MNNEFVDYNTALELKELGFDEPCFGYYLELRNPSEGILTIEKCKNNMDGCLAPTFSQAFRWFREKCELTSWIYNSDMTKFFYTILQNGRIVKSYNSLTTYEEAELECLIKLIEIVKQNGN